MKSVFRKVFYSILTFLFNRKKLIFLLSDNLERKLLSFENGGYLKQVGWVKSVVTGRIVDDSNTPIPWVTYPFISFIENRLNDQLNLFEFGSGNSTYWYATKTKTVTAVEHDDQWLNIIKDNLPINTSLNFCDLKYGGQYCRFALKSAQLFDIIIVDGRDRVNCCRNSIAALNLGGVLILDDSERHDYFAVYDLMEYNGFKKLDFWGMAPAVDYLKCTTLFYKPNNCLNI